MFISFISPSVFKAFILIIWTFWLSSSMLWFTGFLSFHPAGSGFPTGTACHIFSATRISLEWFGAEMAAPWFIWVYREMATTKQNSRKEKLPGPPVSGQPRCYLQLCLWSNFLTLLARIHRLCHFRAHTSCHMVTMCPEQVNRLRDCYEGRKIF